VPRQIFKLNRNQQTSGKTLEGKQEIKLKIKTRAKSKTRQNQKTQQNSKTSAKLKNSTSAKTQTSAKLKLQQNSKTSAKLKNFSKTQNPTQNPTQKSGAGVQDFSCKRVESKVRPVHDRHVSKISWDPAMGREGPDHKKA